mgnify:FL=1
MSQKSQTATSQRLLSLDVLRGITIAGMILVNNPGSWSFVYAPLGHAQWNGLTPTDLVFPFFMFIMGVSMYLSYSKFNFQFSGKTFVKLLRRSVLLFLIGLGIGWLSLSMRQFNVLDGSGLIWYERLWQSVSELGNLRILGVLQRLALVSFFGSLVILLFKPKQIPWLIAGILVGYWLLIAFTGSYAENDSSIISMVDQSVLGISHMYTDHLPDGTSVVFDPEGILSTLPCIAHVLLGFWAGKLISETKVLGEKIQKLFIFGTILLFAGFLLDYGFPINKKIWSSSFVLATCGLGSLLLGLLIWIIDIKHKKNWSVFFESFGVNPMFVYVVAALLSILLGNIKIYFAGELISLKSVVFSYWLQPLLGDYPASLAFALIMVTISWFIGHILYKKKIFIKL